MAPEKVTEMILNVDLKCSGCYKKVKKVICKIPQIREQVFLVDKNMVKIKVVCCSPEDIRDKLCYKGNGSIQSIEIIEKPKEPAEKPKEPAEKPKEPAGKPKVTFEKELEKAKPKDPEKPKPAADKPKDPEKPKPAADKPKPAADKPKDPEKAKPAADKPKDPEKAKPAADKPKDPEKAKPAGDKPKDPEKAKPAGDKPKEPEKPKPASDKPPEPQKAQPKEDKPSLPKEVPIMLGGGPNPEVAKMVYEPVHGYPQMYPISAYPMVEGYGQHYDHYYGSTPFEHGYGMPVPPPPPPSYGGFSYEYGYENGYNGNRGHYASNDYVSEEDDEGCSIM